MTLTEQERGARLGETLSRLAALHLPTDGLTDGQQATRDRILALAVEQGLDPADCLVILNLSAADRKALAPHLGAYVAERELGR